MASIHRKKSRSGRVVWELTHGRGAERIRLVAGRTKEEAEGVLAQFRRQIAQHGSAPQDLTVSQAIRQYQDYLHTNRRRSTLNRYIRVLETFEHCFLNVVHPELRKLSDVKLQHLEDYKRRRSASEISEARTARERAREKRLRDELAQHPKRETMHANAKYGWLGRHPVHRQVSQRTINYELQCLHTFFRWAVKRNHLFLNPAADVEKFRLPKRSIPKFMTSEELRQFFSACDEHQRRLFSTILLTGMRKGEVEHLQWSDVNFELGVIFIQSKPDLGWQPKTDERIIPISPALHQILLEQYARRRNEQLVFANQQGQRDPHILEKLKRVCKKAGIKPTTVHALRHSFGAHLRMAGVNLADIADLLGHKDLATTQIYAKVQQEHLRSVIGKLSGLVPNDASLKCVTQDDSEGVADRKLLSDNKLKASKEEMAERVGFEPTCRLPDKTLSRRPRYDHFGTSP